MTDFFETLVACDPEPEAHTSCVRGRVRLSACNVTVLALDLGNHCGWSIAHRDGRLSYGTEVFTPKKGASPGQRWQQFRGWLSKIISEHQVHVLWFEDVVFGHSSSAASNVYGGYRAVMEMVADAHRVRIESVSVPTVKKAFTGKGNAKKPEMIAAAQAKGFRVADDEDDTADALAILSYAVKQEA